MADALSSNNHPTDGLKDAKSEKLHSSSQLSFQSAPEHSISKPQSQAKTKLKRFRFSDTYDLFLLRSVRDADAHVPQWGETESLFDKVISTFMTLVPHRAFTCMHKPSKKTLIDRFKRLVCARREQNKVNERASGIAEEYGEKENLLDDLILEIDERTEQTRQEKAELQAKETKLIEAGEMIRSKALNRSSKLKRKNHDVTGPESSFHSKRVKQVDALQSDDAITTLIMEQSREQQKRESERIRVEQERLEVEKCRAERELERYETLKSESERRMALEEKRFELEKEERRQAMEERKHMLNIMAALSRKLQ
ncbi:rab11 family-interacting protein 1-like isoform X1 [Gracilaria domingensis]|nr:rab11 family-interacting protein 1-like isoform X1 [Gracilaria domingensis]